MEDIIRIDQAKGQLEEGAREAEVMLAEPSKVMEVLSVIEEKVKTVPFLGTVVEKLPVMISLVKSYITGEYKEVSPRVICAVLGSFIYILKKKDLVSDTIPILGYADDVVVLGLALQFVAPELEAFEKWRAEGAVESTETAAAEAAPESSETVLTDRED